MNNKPQNRVGAALAIMAMLCFMGAFFCLGWKAVPAENKDYLNICLIALNSLVATAFGYFLGSSKSSSDKNSLVSSALAEPISNKLLDNETDKTAGFARLRLLLPLSFLLCFLLALAALYGCATIKSDTLEVHAGKSLLAMKATIITAATAGDELCQRKAVAPAVCMVMADYYKKVQPAYDLAADSLRAVLLHNDPDAWRNYMRDQAAFRDIFDDMLLLSSQYGLLGGVK